LTPAGRAIVRIEKNVPDPIPEPLRALSAEEVKMLAKIFDGG
jgi:hypothetical protein